MKKKKQTPREYAMYLYMMSACSGVIQAPMSDTAIVNCRVRAFLDGVNWQKRRARRAVNGPREP